MNALIDQLIALGLHGMAACAQDLLTSRKPPSLTTALRQLIDAESVERQVRAIQYQMRIAKFPHHKDFASLITARLLLGRRRSNPSVLASLPRMPTISFWWEVLERVKPILPLPWQPI